ncbi:MAG TPA: hypothetical protein VL727_03365 [Puia sp.]|jgi:hypothetical protein|nr:hypothetical protein [Puia sp.]
MAGSIYLTAIAFIAPKTGTTDNGYFTIQRSRNGVNWDSIGVVTRAEGKEDYNFVDMSPFAGNDYYRLALVDRDGGRQLSMTIPVGRAAA